MNQDDLDALVEQAAIVAASMRDLYRGVTGDEPDLDTLIVHYPAVSLAMAAGAGLIAGWWLGRRSVPAPSTPATPTALDYLDTLFPHHMERVRRYLPEVENAEVREVAQTLLDNVVQPRLRDVAARSRFAPLLQRLIDSSPDEGTEENEQDSL